MPPRRPVAQKSQASAQPTCELRHTVYLAVGSASSGAACARPPPLLEGARRRRIGQRDAHRLDLAAVRKLEEIL